MAHHLSKQILIDLIFCQTCWRLADNKQGDFQSFGSPLCFFKRVCQTWFILIFVHGEALFSEIVLLSLPSLRRCLFFLPTFAQSRPSCPRPLSAFAGPQAAAWGPVLSKEPLKHPHDFLPPPFSLVAPRSG